MENTSKYLIHANITADGVVERSDVVGAVFGQTEGLLGDDLDLRDLQQSSKVGRIDVEIDSENGQSFGEITIASSLDKVETAILAAALETIERVGPCRSVVEVDTIEDVRAAKRRRVVERAKELLGSAFADSMLTSQEIVEEVRQSIRVEDISEFEGLPAGPRVADSDAIIVVEGRADVLTLLRYGIKNAIAVEGTNVPESVADLTTDRTVTAFLDGDRGGDLILKELAQVGDVDYVALAPSGRSVEDLARHEVMSALREKVPYDLVADATTPREAVATDGSVRPAPPAVTEDSEAEPGRDAAENPEVAATTEAVATADGATTADAVESPPADTGATEPAGPEEASAREATPEREPDAADADQAATAEPDAAEEPDGPRVPETIPGHVRAVVGEGTGAVRLLDEECTVLVEAPADEAFDAVAEAEAVPATVVLDGVLDQRLLDVAAQRGVEQVVARELGEFVKKPTTVRIRTAEQVQRRP